MYYLGTLTQISSTNWEVGTIHERPFDIIDGLGKSQEELETEGILVESLPELVCVANKIPRLHCNFETKEIWWEYIDEPKTIEKFQAERIDSLESQVESLNIAIAQILGM